MRKKGVPRKPYRSDKLIVYVILNYTTGENSLHYSNADDFKQKMYYKSGRRDSQHRMIIGRIYEDSKMADQIKYMVKSQSYNRRPGYIVRFMEHNQEMRFSSLKAAGAYLGCSSKTVRRSIGLPWTINGNLIITRKEVK